MLLGLLTFRSLLFDCSLTPFITLTIVPPNISANTKTNKRYHLLQLRALKIRVRALLKDKGMFVLDAFRAFDSDRDGLLSCSELYGGLDWLGLGALQAEHVQEGVNSWR